MSEVAVMTPLKVTAVMAGPVSLNFGSIALDALLASQVARRDGLEPPMRGQSPEQVPVPPLARHPSGFYLASWAISGDLLWSYGTHIHRPVPADWYARLCTDKVRRVDVSSGVDKAYRVPRHRTKFRELVWFCLGDAEQIEVLLRGVTSLGSYRRDGIGRRKEWRVELCKAWDGFPVLREGVPLRSLPLDYPGLADGHRTGMASLNYPYWEPMRQEMLAIP